MSQRYLGGIITANPTAPTLTSASGVWTTEQQFQNIANWPKSTGLVSRSVRLRSSASAYFNRTPAGASNRKTWTWSGWVKRGSLGAAQILLSSDVGTSNSTWLEFGFDAADTFTITSYTTDSNTTAAVFRDPSSWYHIVVAFDSTQATSANRCKIYVNGTQQTLTGAGFTLNADYGINNAQAHAIGYRNWSTPGRYFDGYMTEINFIDGQALTPSYFGFTDGNGVWQPATYSGTYGTNGFYLPFTSNTGTAENKVLYSQQIDNAAWAKNNVTVTADNTTAPDGTTTAELLTGTSTSTPRVNQSITISASTTYSFSFYAKIGTATYSFVTLYDGGTNGNRAWWNLSTGSVGSTAVVGTGFASFSTSIQSVGNGWYRCVATFTSNANTSLTIDGISVNMDTNGSLTTTSGLTGYLWGVQLSAGSTAPPYFFTTSSVQASTNLLGSDASISTGGYNNWVANNISITAGATYDSMLDVPTPYADGGNGRGNYAVMNPLSAGGATLSNGNLDITATAVNQYKLASFNLPTSGKWYFELTVNTLANTNTGFWINTSQGGVFGLPASGVYRILYSSFDISVTGSGTPAAGHVMKLAYDASSGKIWLGRDTLWFSNAGNTTSDPSAGTNPSFSGLVPTTDDSIQILETGGGAGTCTASINFGQRPFTYTPPTGFVALNTQNMPTPTISNGATVMAATTYTGTGATQTISNAVNGVSFQPDFVWVKGRSGATDNAWYDAVRGVQKQLESNTTTAETTETTGLTAFGSTGFTVGALAQMNTNTATYVAWQWNAGGSTVTNTSGSISSQVRASTTAGFSVVTYTGNGTNPSTVGHGLGVAPKMMIFKDRSGVANWPVYHASLGNTSALLLDTTGASTATVNWWNNTSPTSSVFTIGSNENPSGRNHVAYCFAEVAGYSAFGSYTGNGSADGPFVFLGFRPRFVMIRNPAIVANWLIFDSSRDTYNPEVLFVFANTSDAEQNSSASVALDFVSNGFKIRQTSGNINASGNALIYMAFAENPFKLSRAR